MGQSSTGCLTARNEVMLEAFSFLVLLLVQHVQPLTGKQCVNSLEAREKENILIRNPLLLKSLVCPKTTINRVSRTFRGNGQRNKEAKYKRKISKKRPSRLRPENKRARNRLTGNLKTRGKVPENGKKMSEFQKSDDSRNTKTTSVPRNNFSRLKYPKLDLFPHLKSFPQEKINQDKTLE